MSFDERHDRTNNDFLAITSADQWQLECECAAYCAGTLLRLARRRYAASAIVELLRTMPRTTEDMELLQHTAIEALDENKGFSTHPSLYLRCVSEAYHFGDHDVKLLGSIIAYWSKFAMMPPERRAMLEASVIGTVLGNGMSC